eukprot:326142_1
MVLDMVTDQLDVKFPSYPPFVDGFGDVFIDKCFVVPRITTVHIGSRTAEFDIECDGTGFDETTHYVYRVQLFSKDDGDAKSNDENKWNNKDFSANPIEIEHLSPNTKYAIRCKIKYENNIVSKCSKTHRFITNQVDIFEIRRGTISTVASWNYNDKMNAVSFVSNKTITIYGVGVFDCKGTVKAKYEIFKEEKDQNNKEKKIIYMGKAKERTFTRNAASKTPIRFDLDRPVYIEKNTKYTIQLKQQNDGSGSYFVDPGHAKVTVNRATITFFNAPNSPN